MIDAAAGDYSSHLIEQQVTTIGEWGNWLVASTWAQRAVLASD